jgi:hypothetical protein
VVAYLGYTVKGELTVRHLRFWSSGMERHWFVVAVAMVVTGSLVWASPTTSIQISGTTDRILIDYNLADHQACPVQIAGEAFEEIVLFGEATTMEPGAPSLPVVCRSVIIPDDRKMSVRVVTAEYHETSARIAPSKGSISRYLNPDDVPYRFGPVYEHDAFYPDELVALGEPYVLRDYRGVVVKLHPFRYNPVTGALRVHTRVTVELFDTGPAELNPLQIDTEPRLRSRAFHQLYRHHFLNYDSYSRYDPLNESGGILIVAHDPWVPYVQPLIAHKTSIGMTTELVPVSVVGNNPEAIKALIQDRYDHGGLAFVLLVGDAEHVASPDYQMPDNVGPSDPTYSLLAGDDSYPDIMVGRLSAETAEHVMTQVERIIEYEQMPATQQEWFWRGSGLGSAEGPGDDGEMDWEHIEQIRMLLLDHHYTEVDQFYDPGAEAVDVQDALNDGRGIVNYCGHGGPGGWGTSGFSIWHVDALINHNMLPFIFSVACDNGSFDGQTCMGEAFLRATHESEPTGGIGFFGGSLAQYWSEPMEAQDEFNSLLVQETYVSYGTLCYAGCCSMMDQYGEGGDDMFMTWHVFGDPSLRVVGTCPSPSGLLVEPFTGLISSGPVGGPFAPSSITYTVTNLETSPLVFEATTAASWITLSSTGATIPPQSETYLIIWINDVAETFNHGYYEASVSFINTTDHVGDTERMVVLDVGVPVPVYSFFLDSDPGWAVTGEWAFGEPTGQGGDSYGYPDPNSGATGEMVYGVNLNGDYSPETAGPFYLTTVPMDCRYLCEVSLHFQRWLNTDFQPYTSATLEMSDNGTDWEMIWENGGVEIAECAWDEQVYDISSFADSCHSLHIRWGYETSGPAYPYSGWNIDDVEIYGLYLPAGVPKTPGNIFVEPDGMGGLILTWSPVTEDMTGAPIIIDHYEVFRHTMPHYSIAMLVPIGSPSLPLFSDEDVTGDPGVNYYYRITAVADDGTTSAASAPVGEFDFEQTVTAGPPVE